MSTPLIKGALRSRYHMAVGALAIAVIVRMGQASFSGGPWVGSQTDFAFSMVAWAILIPAFAALLGADLSGRGQRELPFILARPVARQAVILSRLGADLITILASVAFFWVLTPLAPSEQLPLAVMMSLMGVWLGVHGLAAMAGALGLRSLAASASAFLGVWTLVLIAQQAVYGALNLMGHTPAVVEGEGAIASQGLYLWISIVSAQVCVAVSGLGGWFVADRALSRAPIPLARGSAIVGVGGLFTLALAASVLVGVGLSYALAW